MLTRPTNDAAARRDREPLGEARRGGAAAGGAVGARRRLRARQDVRVGRASRVERRDSLGGARSGHRQLVQTASGGLLGWGQADALYSAAFCLTGGVANGASLGDTIYLDTTFMTWNQPRTSQPPRPRSQHAACVLGTRFIIFGGSQVMARASPW